LNKTDNTISFCVCFYFILIFRIYNFNNININFFLILKKKQKRGKVHFGYIYGVSSLGSIGIHFIFNLMSEAQLEPSNTGSILGYCLLPIVVLSAISTFLKPR